MPNQPERPVERLLREAARKRREAAGAPFELHPATRRLLQSEVAREFPAPAAAPERCSFFTLFWPRLALGALGVLVICLAVIPLLSPGPGQKQELLAKNDETTRPEAPTALARSEPAPPAESSLDRAPTKVQTLAEATPTPAPAPPPQRAAKPRVATPYSDLPKDEARKLVTIRASDSGAATVSGGLPDPGARLAMAPQPAAAPAQSPGSGSGGSVRNREVRKSPQQPNTTGILALAAGEAQPQTSESDAAAPVHQPTSAMNFSDKTDVVTLHSANLPSVAVQEFTRVSPSKSKPADYGTTLLGPDAVLVSFKLEQAGKEVRVVDRDGSVYAGPLEFSASPDLFARRLNPRPSTPAAGTSAAPLQSPALPGYFFKLTGTNRSLNQKVIFTGTLLATNQVPSGTPSVRAVPSGAVPPLRSSRVSGRLLVGDAKVPIEVEAVPVKAGAHP